MTTKKKIAICVSGQTRHFNSNPVYTQNFLEILDLFNDYDYDLFGHTWSDHEDPHSEVLEKFTEYRSDDQEIIWNDILSAGSFNSKNYVPTWDQFFQTNEDWYAKSEYLDILNGKSSTSYIDFAKERIKGTVGQVWSAHESFRLTKEHLAENKYQMVIKLRWDLMIKYFNGSDWVVDNKQRFKNMLNNWINKEVDFKQLHVNPTCLASDDCVITKRSSPYVNDHIFVLDGITFLRYNIASIKPVDILAKLLLNYQPVGPLSGRLPSAHTLWMDWILNAGFIVSPKLPNMFQANGRDVIKINKDWNI